MMLAFFLTALLQLTPSVVFDSLVYDFGAHPVSDSELNHSFEFRNESGSDVSISYALATCPCTTLSWTRESVAPGGKGQVTVSYSKELYSQLFDKTVSVFFEGESRPVLLRISGSFFDTPETLAADFPVLRGTLGLEGDSFNIGEQVRGREFRGRFFVANTGEDPLDLRLDTSDAALSVTPSVFDIPAFERKLIDYSVILDTLAWGWRTYSIIPVVGGDSFEPVEIRALLLDDFSSLSSAERNNGPLCTLTRDAYSFGLVKGGSPVVVQITLKNVSSVPAAIRHCGSSNGEITAEWPASVEPGSFGNINVTIGAKALVPGANSIKVSIVTNSPLRPFMEAEIVGYVE